MKSSSEFARKRTKGQGEEKIQNQTEASLESSDRENTKRERSFAPESITRHVSVLSPSFSRALCARVRSGSNQSERQEKRILTVEKNMKEQT